MLNPRELPPSVLAFLGTFIRSVEDLALLIAIIDAPDRWWDASSAAQELGSGTHAAIGVLEHLARHSLLDIRVTGDVRYRFHPVSDELRSAALACAAAYRAHPASVVRAVSDARRRSIQDFADAFKLRRNSDG